MDAIKVRMLQIEIERLTRTIMKKQRKIAKLEEGRPLKKHFQTRIDYLSGILLERQEQLQEATQGI